MASEPIRVPTNPRSVRTRASTGNAVTLIDTAMNSTNGNRPTPGGANEPNIARASSEPRTSGSTMLA